MRPMTRDERRGIGNNLRFDRRIGTGRGDVLGPRRSGRWFVVGFVVGFAVLWGGLKLAHRDWKAKHRGLAEFGSKHVATTVDPLAELKPTEVSAKVWAGLVRDTHQMLVALTSSGAMDRGRMIALREDLAGRVTKATSETAVADLAGIWADMELLAGPRLDHAPRPDALELARAITPLRRSVPPGVDPVEWDRALDDTRVMLVVLAASGGLNAELRKSLRDGLAERVVKVPPSQPIAFLTRLWDEVREQFPKFVSPRRRPGLVGGA